MISHPATAQAPQPGIYDSVQLAVDPQTGVISGSFFDQTGRGQFTCAFLIRSEGKPSATGIYPIVIWNPNASGDEELARGTLRVDGNAIGITLPPRAHGGCWNVNADLDQGKETTLQLEKPRPWREERLVQAAKVPFYNAPDESKRSAAYIGAGRYRCHHRTAGPVATRGLRRQ